MVIFHSYVKLPEGTIVKQPQNTAVFVFQQRSRGPAMRSMRHSPAPSQAEADRAAQGFASPGSRQASTWVDRLDKGE
jgi:hypothetical protein